MEMRTNDDTTGACGRGAQTRGRRVPDDQGRRARRAVLDRHGRCRAHRITGPGELRPGLRDADREPDGPVREGQPGEPAPTRAARRRNDVRRPRHRRGRTPPRSQRKEPSVIRKALLFGAALAVLTGCTTATPVTSGPVTPPSSASVLSAPSPSPTGSRIGESWDTTTLTPGPGSTLVADTPPPNSTAPEDLGRSTASSTPSSEPEPQQ